MTREEFAKLLSDFTHSAESGDGARFAQHFCEDGIYYDYIYGPHTGRADIAYMMQDLFHRDATDYRWEMFDPVFDGRMGYAWSLSSFTSTIPQFRGKRVVIDDPRSLRDLPRAAEANGHHVVHVGEGDPPWTITLEV